MQELKIALVQANLIWEDISANLMRLEECIERSGVQADLYVLPEMFSTAFSMRARDLAETSNGLAHQWLRKQAHNAKAAFAGSLIVVEQDRFFNRLVWVDPAGQEYKYDKRHLFRMAKEDAVYSPGSAILETTWLGWRFRPLICYDLRFPVWSRNLGSYDALVYVANWPAKRHNHWTALLKARAIENQSYVIAVNRIGSDQNGITYAGGSCIVDPWGEVVYDASGEEGVHFCTLSAEVLQRVRANFPTSFDQDKFSIEY